MIFIWLALVSTIIRVAKNEAHDTIITNSSIETTLPSFPDKKYLGDRLIESTTLDRDWERYLNELKRLKSTEMKKAIRSTVLGEDIYPYPLQRIRRRLELLKLYDPDNVRVGHVKNNRTPGNAIYKTLSGQGILYVKISESDEGDKDREKEKKNIARPIVLLVAGIGGNDWMAVRAIIHLVTNLATSYEKGKLSGFDWWIIPVLNPDGYINSMDNRVSRYYGWNINPAHGCPGVNLDRNFLLQRLDCRDGRRRINCQEYPGEYPFSEIESRALRDFIFAQARNCKVFVALKEGAKALVYPFASTLSSPRGPHTILQDLLCTEALEAFDQFNTGKKYLFRFGNSGRIFGPSSGYVEDWAKRRMGIPRSFAFYVGQRHRREHVPVKRLEEFGKATMKAVQVLVASRRFEPYPETFEEFINETRLSRLSKYIKSRPTPWGRESVNDNLLDKINRDAKLEMPIEFTRNERDDRYDRFQ